MKKIWKKILAVTLALSMTMSMVSMTSLAVEGESEETRTTYCGKEEHTHSVENGCYKLICGKEEAEGHEHTDACYEIVRGNLTCGLEESGEHTHTDECYEMVRGDLICGLEESEGHQHVFGDSDVTCYDNWDNDGDKWCGKEAHVHVPACYVPSCTCAVHCDGECQTKCAACMEDQGLCKGEEIQQPEGWAASFDSETGTLTINGTGELTMEILDSLVFAWSDSSGNFELITLNNKNIKWDVNGLVKKLVIGEGITAIGKSVFDGNIKTGNGPRYLANVTEIVLPETLVSIGDFAFDSCGAYGETLAVNFPSSLESIGVGAFEGSQKLEKVEISSSNVVIGQGAFFACPSLKEIQINGAKEIGDYAFQACDSLKTITLENIDRIGMCIISGEWGDEYWYENGPTSLTLKNIGTIGAYAFQRCENLKTVVLENVTTVEDDAFFQCWELNHADLTNVGTLMGFVFQDTALESVTMNKVGTINRNAFYYNENLTTVTGLDTVERIDGFAFYGCSNLTGLTVADATKMGFNGDNYADVMERVQAILDGQFSLDDAATIAELTPETDWTNGKVGKSENWNTYDHGTQLREQARWTNANKTEAEVEVTAYYTAEQQMDYIFVVDLSASMAQLGNLADKNARFYDMQSKMLDMTDKLLKTPGYDCRVAFVTFGGAVVYNNGWVDPAISETIPFTDDVDTAAASIKAMKPLDQNTDYGLAMTKTLELAKTNGGRNTTVIFMSDGQPVVDGETKLPDGTLDDAYCEKVAAKAAEIEELGINIYGVLHSVTDKEHDNAVKAMEAVCTEGLFFEAKNTEEFSKSVNAAMNAANGGTYTVNIPVHSDFESVNGLTTSNPDDTVTVENGTIAWTITGMPFTKHTLTYKMSLTKENAGKTGEQKYFVNNGNADIAGGASVESPELTREFYNVTYTDGVEDAELFADQTANVLAGTATPTFEGTPTRSGYTFTGWDPEVAETVTGDVTYVAQWRSNYVAPTYYTLTINYVDGEGNTVADRYTTRQVSGYRYSVTSPAVAGMTPDQATVSGILTGNTTLTVTYSEDLDEPDTPTTESPEPTESPDPIESPEPTETQEPDETEDLDETDTPLAEKPDVEPTETPDEGEDLGDNDTPLADVPQTGDMLWLWMTLAAGSAVSLAWISAEEKKGKRVSK